MSIFVFSLLFNNNIYRISIWWCSKRIFSVIFVKSLFDFVHYSPYYSFRWSRDLLSTVNDLSIFLSRLSIEWRRWGVREHAKSIDIKHDYGMNERKKLNKEMKNRFFYFISFHFSSFRQSVRFNQIRRCVVSDASNIDSFEREKKECLICSGWWWHAFS